MDLSRSWQVQQEKFTIKEDAILSQQWNENALKCRKPIVQRKNWFLLSNQNHNNNHKHKAVDMSCAWAKQYQVEK